MIAKVKDMIFLIGLSLLLFAGWMEILKVAVGMIPYEICKDAFTLFYIFLSVLILVKVLGTFIMYPGCMKITGIQ